MIEEGDFEYTDEEHLIEDADFQENGIINVKF